MRWNGRAWSRITFPYAGFATAPVAPDGHGRIWLADGGEAILKYGP